MSSSPIKKYNTSEIVKTHLLKLKDLKDRGLIKTHELAQMTKLETDLVEIEKRELNKPPSNYPKRNS
jgi:hypothetical protein